MFGITVSEAAKICGGSVVGPDRNDPELSRLIIDSREVRDGDLFVAYKGGKLDGHNYIISALEKGAACALAEHLPKILPVNPELRSGELPEGMENLLPGPVILVRDVQLAMENLAVAFRKRVDVPVIGVTGSVGKTTAKEMIASVLSQRFKVHKTAGNRNNTIGLPLSLCCMEQSDECAVLEMGINHFGEMRRLGRMAAPDIAVYTNIGHAHLEFLGNLKGVLRAKTEMLEFMAEDALLIVNGDDPLLRDFECSQWKLTYGTSEECDVRATEIRTDDSGCISCRISYGTQTVYAAVSVPGEHMVYGALIGAAAGFAMGLSESEIEAGITAYAPVGRRFSMENLGPLRLIDDCYNANPDSTKSSIASLSSLPGRHVCILGNMLELGENSEEMHRQVGAFAAEKQIDLLLTCGELAAHMAGAYQDAGGSRTVAYPDKPSLIRALPDLLKTGDGILVKASLGSHLEEVSEAVKTLVRQEKIQ